MEKNTLQFEPLSQIAYEVSVNFHFDFKELTTKEKFAKIETILSETYYSKFLATSQEFLALNDR